MALSRSPHTVQPIQSHAAAHHELEGAPLEPGQVLGEQGDDWRHEHGIPVTSVPQNMRVGPNAS